jgi:RNA polymerase sigma factor (TIGR02999 family)
MDERLDKGERDRLFGAAYQELRRLAVQVRAGRAGETLSPTALVNEVYVKLSRSLRVRPRSRLHFKRIAAQAMRQVLVQAARRRQAEKRGGNPLFVTFDEGRDIWPAPAAAVVALDVALAELAELHPRQAKVVECRFFGGLDREEIAAWLGVSGATVDRDWRAAKAWLSLRVRRGSGVGAG